MKTLKLVFSVRLTRIEGEAVAEYKYNNATVRIHGTADRENLKRSTEKYLKKVVRSKKNAKEKKKAQVGQHH